MRVLGIGDHVVSGAALVEDGCLVAAVNEERLVRRKMVMGFPWKSIESVLEMGGVQPGELDAVAVASHWGHFLPEYVDFGDGAFGVDEGAVRGAFFDLGSTLAPLRAKLPFLETLYYGLRRPLFARRRSAIRRVLRERYGITCPVEFVWHHFAHAAAAYHASGLHDALGVTLDASGDGHSSHVYDFREGGWSYTHGVPAFDSLGVYYAYVTQICGFKAGRHEGKITGLAAYGTPAYRDVLERFIRYEDGSMANVANAFRQGAMKKLRAALPKDVKREDLAASIQDHTEDIAVRYVSHWLRQTGQRRVVLAGGVAANVKVNQRIHEIPGVEEVFVYPAMSDEGLPAGAALAECARLAPESMRPGSRCLDHVYLGPEFSRQEMLRALDAAGVDYSEPANLEANVARRLADGYVVARFAGRMEYGPRALGNRSILYRPDDPAVNDWLNERLSRTEFMPFAPVTLAEHADDSFECLDGARDAARFMTIAFDGTPTMQKQCPGVVHIDGTARPQVLSQADNPSYYRTLDEFHRITGIPSLVNTSFNLHEEPIVCTPEDAIRAFQIGHLDMLAMGPFLAVHARAGERGTGEGHAPGSGGS
ncbi:MAG: carbamoyltransferase [Deltaproteobacteria bacterium]|nr:carbamoyltransferase [Deltaproteobacteria bacterium]MBW2361427.1 carbamoyltransferase [Deltaproteobacteria bacterium]